MHLYEEIVGRGGVSPAYFFEHMTFSECAAFMRGQNRKELDKLKRTRLIMWSVLQSQSKKSLELDDIMNLEDESPEESDTSSLEDLRKRAKMFEK